MTQITLRFAFMEKKNRKRLSTAADLNVLIDLGLSGLPEKAGEEQISGILDVDSPQDCSAWYSQYDALDAVYQLWTNLAFTKSIQREGSFCIGRQINTKNTVTIYLKSKERPADIAQALGTAVAAPSVNVLKSASEVTSYLAGQQRIRLYVDNSPGRGHQTTTCAIVRRFIALGYSAAVDVIYRADNGTAGKIKLLLPELDLAVDGETIKAGPVDGGYTSAALGNCQFKFFKKGIDELEPECQFGISGGVDDPSVDPRKFCNSKYFLTLQPAQFNAKNLLFVTGGEKVINLGDQAVLGKSRFVGCACYLVETGSYTWEKVTEDVQRLDPGIRRVVEGIQGGCCGIGGTKLLLPVYGLSLSSNPQGNVLSNWSGVTQIEAFANLVLSVLAGQASGPLRVGTVILTLDSYPADWVSLLQQNLPQSYHQRLSYWQLNQPWNDPIGVLNEDSVLIVNLPMCLPGPVFNYFYLNSQLPPLFEGQGTLPIMLNSGRPYLRLSKSLDGFSRVNTTAGPTLKYFIYPTLPFNSSIKGDIEIETPCTLAGTCLAAGNAIVNNQTREITISVASFPTAPNAFPAIEKYLQKNFYVDATNQILNKFKALESAQLFESEGFPAGVDSDTLYDDLQAACGVGAANVCNQYRERIGHLSAFFLQAISDTPTREYFVELREYFNNIENDKLLKAMGFAVAAIAADM